jgi:hypothetical protein
MKRLLTLLGFFLTVNTFSQSGNDVSNALKEGNATKFTSYFSNSIDVKLPEKDDMKNLTKANASGLIQSFFEKNQITGCELFLPARELNGMTYVAGKLKGATQDYNITVVLKKTSGNEMAAISVRIF